MKRRLAWLIAVPLAVIGSLAGHSVAYRAAVPDVDERAEVLAASGHGYLDYAPLAIALCVALAGLGFAAAVLDSFGRRDRRRVGGHFVLVAALAPVAFTLQELGERYAHDGQYHWQLLISSPFLLGLVLQLPFALLAAAIAYALATAARLVAGALEPARPRRAGTPFVLPSQSVELPRTRALAGGSSVRGPPLLV